MKKILSLTLAVLMVVSMIPTAFAAEAGGNWAGGTQVAANGSRTTTNDDGTTTHNVEYTITVPASLAPGGEGTVTLQGMWPSDATVKVTADASVDMLNSITNADKKTLVVTFPSIEKTGDNTQAVSASANVSVADIEAALFGTWNGKFNYNVDYVAGSGNTSGGSTGGDSGTTVEPSDPDDGDGEEVTTFTFSIDNVQKTAETGMTWAQWAESEYNTDGYKVITAKQTFSDTETVELIANETNYVKNVIASDVIEERVMFGTSSVADDYAHPDYPMHFTIDDVQYNFIKGMTYGDWVNSECNTIGCVVANIKHRNTGSEMQAIVTADKTKYLMDGSPVELSDTISKYDTNEWIEFGSSGSWWELVE